MSPLEPEELVEMLAFLKEMRQNLVSDFISREREVFIPMFAYENESVSMDISIEKYFLGWLNEHFLFFSKESRREKSVSQVFLASMSSLLQEHLRYKQGHLFEDSESFIFRILTEKMNLLESLLSISEDSNKKYNDLLFAKERDRALFQRQLDNLKEQN